MLFQRVSAVATGPLSVVRYFLCSKKIEFIVATQHWPPQRISAAAANENMDCTLYLLKNNIAASKSCPQNQGLALI
jgi:hypothetical protein